MVSVSFVNDEEWDIFNAICERTFHRDVWKIFGMHSLTKFEVLFLARLSGTLEDKELDRLRDIYGVPRDQPFQLTLELFA